MNLYDYFNRDKKLILKVIAGVLLLVIAFFSYLLKNTSKDEAIVLSEGVGGVSSAAMQATGSAIEDEALPAEIVIDISGAVGTPSVLILPEGSRVYEAVEKAGGFTAEADTRFINQAEMLSDGQKLYIPTKAEIEKAQGGNGSIGSAALSGSGAAAVPGLSMQQSDNQGLININTADSAALQQLSGVGPSTAEKIISYRTENGPFQSIEDIKNVSGIGDKTFEKFKNKIKVK